MLVAKTVLVGTRRIIGARLAAKVTWGLATALFALNAGPVKAGDPVTTGQNHREGDKPIGSVHEKVENAFGAFAYHSSSGLSASGGSPV